MAQEREVYILRASNGTVKIGSTTDVRGRLAGMNSFSPLPLKLVAVMPGGEKREAELHKQFSHLRVKGEWFQTSPEIETLISEWEVEYEPRKASPYYSAGRRPPLKFITDAIRNLKIGESIMITDAAPNSVKSITCRMKKKFNGRRRYATRKQDHGVMVWRTP